ncbi:MAG TPA: hypothetical protein VEX15_12210 [Nocardioidaceae bacterium]|nr:hypothetical protein [Nocardioidaceae bacterium]
MTRIRKLLIAVASAAVVASVASVASPASAEEQTFTDKKGDVRGGFDIQSVQVVNTGKWVKIRTHHRNLRYGEMAPGGGVSVYIDTVRRRNGPEFRFAGPVGFDGDYSLLRVRRWDTFGGPLNCNRLRFGVNYQRDVVRFAVPRRCLDRAYDHRVGKVRVAVKAAQSRSGGGHPRVDWAPKRRTLYSAVPRG